MHALNQDVRVLISSQAAEAPKQSLTITEGVIDADALLSLANSVGAASDPVVSTDLRRAGNVRQRKGREYGYSDRADLVRRNDVACKLLPDWLAVHNLCGGRIEDLDRNACS